MFEIEDIREWRGQSVVDAGKRRIGTLEAIYFDTATDEPSFATVTVGLPTQRKLVFVPLRGCTVGPEYLKVIYDKKQVRDAPAIGTDGELLAADEPQVFAHYELPYAAGASGERRLARR
ncbi:PRC-barrel domain-containing protein [Streptomyces sp. NPDC058045]|uniref:PRC-barrel domain-containing protein n=1 Tax=Streptomyces sp. NPDC058045 TaxID=3346311 RepID=UPI0036EBB05B